MQNQHRINYQTSYFGNTVLYVVESVGSIADNTNIDEIKVIQNE